MHGKYYNVSRLRIFLRIMYYSRLQSLKIHKLSYFWFPIKKADVREITNSKTTF